ncbi:hypothetical protein CHS0354_037695 [Potamilus streckersoni]|uniref:Uncharacterized protein n=1 Tax=Potamilus streckersoni TaxID=2493646 RepID=A0AAE0W5V0_9BIVA|nr:hypothetical protein CHS0354_037695 [Potamilus streckersoni]
MVQSVCGKKQYETWKEPCGMTINPVESGMDKDAVAIQMKEKMDHIVLNMREAKQILGNLKIHYIVDRIQNTEYVQVIERYPDSIFAYGVQDVIEENDKVLTSNATAIVLKDNDSITSAVMFTEQIRFNEDSSKFYGKLNKGLEYKSLSEKLANILCDFELILAMSGITSRTKIKCKTTVPELIKSSGNEEERIYIEYRVLFDINLYLIVMISKYQQLKSLIR